MKIKNYYKQIQLILNKVLFITLLTSVSCSSFEENEKFKEYYPNGNVKIEYAMKDSVLNGIYIDYYENGMLKSKCSYKNGKCYGRYLEFYKSGDLKYQLYYDNNKLIGSQLEYYDNKLPTIKSKKLFFIYNNKSYLSMYKGFKNGNTIFDYSDVKLSSDYDTLELGEIKQIRVQKVKNKYNMWRIEIGNYNRNFILLDSSNVKHQISKDSNFIIMVNAKKLGRNVVRGWIENYYVDKIENGITTTIGNYPSCFEYNYFVK
jgi:hypothetical protein